MPGYGDAAIRQRENALNLGTSAHSVLLRFVAVHDDIFAGATSRLLRQIVGFFLPINWFFREIPYRAHAKSLASLGTELRQLLQTIDQLSISRDEVDEQILVLLKEYCESLEIAIHQLGQLSLGLAQNADGQPGPSLREYGAQYDKYTASCQRYAKIGAELNRAFRR